MIAQCYLASVVAFLVEQEMYGTKAMEDLFSATDVSAPEQLARSLGMSLEALEEAWSIWLRNTVSEHVERQPAF